MKCTFSKNEQKWLFLFHYLCLGIYLCLVLIFKTVQLLLTCFYRVQAQSHLVVTIASGNNTSKRIITKYCTQELAQWLEQKSETFKVAHRSWKILSGEVMDSCLSQGHLCVNQCNKPDWNSSSAIRFLISICYPLHHTTHPIFFFYMPHLFMS